MNKPEKNSGKRVVANLSEVQELIEKAIENGGEFRIITAGTSMQPLLRNRCDTVVLVKAGAGKLKKYDIPLYKRKNGQYVLHRIMKCGKDEYCLCGDNQTEFERGITDSDIIAVVSRIVRNGNEIALDTSKLYKLYVFFWCRCFFLRFLILKLRMVCSVVKNSVKSCFGHGNRK